MDVSTMAWGPDVNSYHPIHSWKDFVGSGAAMLGAKATEGATFEDKTFRFHRDGFRTHCAGMLGIWYHFFKCAKDPVSQAEHLADVVGPLGPRERLCCDFEGKSYITIPPAELRKFGLLWLDSFYGRLENLGALAGTRPLIYTSAQHWRALGDPTWARARGIDLWVPRYHLPDPKAPDAIPGPWAGWSILQYTDGDKGIHREIPGVGLCDVNVLAPEFASATSYSSDAGAIT